MNIEEWLWYVKLTPTYNFYIPFSLNDESFFCYSWLIFFYFEKTFFFLCVLCVNHKFRYNCFICLFFSPIMSLYRETERRKRKRPNMNSSLTLSRTFSQIFLSRSRLWKLSHTCPRVVYSPILSQISLSRLIFISSIHIFMYKAMQSMLMKTSASSFSPAFLFFALLYAFFPFIFSVSQQ